jgi:hypothetical protein
MKQYVIDQLRTSDFESIQQFLDSHAESSGMEGIYWVNLPPELYSTIQSEHSKCQPYYFAISLDWNSVAFELLIRSRQLIRCRCISYANRQQRDHILHFAECMIEDLQLRL